jgi:hypothetical protein
MWMKKQLVVIFLIVALAALFFGGAGGIILSAQYAWSAVQSVNWPTADGRIISSEIDSQSNHASRRTTDRRTYIATVRYRYSVDGESYEGTRIAFDELHSYDTREQAQAVLDNFENQRSIAVYYDPTDPTNAALITGGTWQTYTPLALSAAAFLLGGFTIVTLIMSYRSRRTRAEDMNRISSKA